MNIRDGYAWFRHTAERIENGSLPFPRYIGLFFALLVVRLCLEFFSSHRLYTADDVVHIGLWFAFVVLAFMSLLQAATGEAMIKIARLSIVCYVFSWSAPLIDLLVHRGVPARMNYIAINSWADFVQAYLTFGGPSLMRGATLGIRIEIACLVVACFLYVHGKRNSLVRAALAALAIYSMLFATGAIPYLLGLVVSALGLQYTQDDQSTVLLLYCLNAGLLSHVVLRQAPALWHDLAAAPWSVVGIGLLAFGIGAGLAHHAYPTHVVLTPTTMFWSLIVPWMALAFSLWLGLTRSAEPATIALRIAIWCVLSAGALLLDIHFAFALQLLFALCWLWQQWLAPWRGRSVITMIGLALVWPAAALAGFQLMGGPMVGFPGLWLLAISAFGACAGLLSGRLEAITSSNKLRSVAGEE